MIARCTLAVLFALALLSPFGAQAGRLDDCNVVWDSPSADSFGSMPLGNGDVGATSGSRRTATCCSTSARWTPSTAGHLLPKLGRVRLRFNPALAVERFPADPGLRDGAIAIRAGDVDLRVWVDANSPVIRVTGTSETPVDVGGEFRDAARLRGAGRQADRLAWGYRNTSSAWMDHVRAQNTPEFAAKVADPILNRTSGCRLSGEGSCATASARCKLRGRANGGPFGARAVQPDGDAAGVVRRAGAAGAVRWARAPASGGGRSGTAATSLSGGAATGRCNLDQCRFTQFPQGSQGLSRAQGDRQPPRTPSSSRQRYALERFCEAAASRGAVPPPYNGSIFTMDMPAGVLGFRRAEGEARSRPTAATGRSCPSCGRTRGIPTGRWPRAATTTRCAGHAVRARRPRHLPRPLPEDLRPRRRVHHGGELVAQRRRVRLGRRARPPALPSPRHDRDCRRSCASTTSTRATGSSSTRCCCPAPTSSSSTTRTASRSATPAARC